MGPAHLTMRARVSVTDSGLKIVVANNLHVTVTLSLRHFVVNSRSDSIQITLVRLEKCGTRGRERGNSTKCQDLKQPS